LLFLPSIPTLDIQQTTTTPFEIPVTEIPDRIISRDAKKSLCSATIQRLGTRVPLVRFICHCMSPPWQCPLWPSEVKKLTIALPVLLGPTDHLQLYTQTTTDKSIAVAEIPDRIFIFYSRHDFYKSRCNTGGFSRNRYWAKMKFRASD
jgi:hypothetical protein